MGARASKWSAGINQPPSHCLGGIAGSHRRQHWRTMPACGTRCHSAHLCGVINRRQPSGEERGVMRFTTVELCAVERKPPAGERSANGPSLVVRCKRITGSDRRKAVQCSRSPLSDGRVLHHLHCGTATDWVPRGHRAEVHYAPRWLNVQSGQCNAVRRSVKHCCSTKRAPRTGANGGGVTGRL